MTEESIRATSENSTVRCASSSSGASSASVCKISIVRKVQVSIDGFLSSPRSLWAFMILIRALGSTLSPSSLLRA
jgi:hypothetical protein